MVRDHQVSPSLLEAGAMCHPHGDRCTLSVVDIVMLATEAAEVVNAAPAFPVFQAILPNHTRISAARTPVHTESKDLGIWRARTGPCWTERPL